jgi:transmembrane sensor
MQESEFKNLLEKYLNGSITNSEMELLEQFKKNLDSQNTDSFFTSKLHRNEIKESVWGNIEAGILKELFAKVKKWSKYAAAAVFTGFIAVSYFYLDSATNDTSIHIPENSITLQLEDGTIKVINEIGKVKVINAQGNVVGQQEGARLEYAASHGTKEIVFNTLSVPYGKTFELRLSDGTEAYLNAGSSIKYPVQFITGLNREIQLTGEAYLRVAKDTAHAFVVIANDLHIQVLGTEFNVSAYPEDDATEVVLVEGSVNLYTEAEGYNTDKNTLLKPGFKGSLNKNGNNINTTEVITSIYTSWIDGKLVFRNMTFENILKKLERHYDVTIVNYNTELMNEKFNANFGNEPIEKVLKELRNNYGIQYKFLDSSIIIN